MPALLIDHYAIATFAIVGTVLAAAIILWLAHWSRFAPVIESFRGVSPNLLGVMGVLFALNLVFLANDTWHAHDRALDAVFQEAGSLRNIVALAGNLPGPARARVGAAVKDYTILAVDTEWPLLADRQSSPAASAALDRLLALLSGDEIGRLLDKNVQALLMGQAIEVRSARDLRIALSQTHVNPLKWLGMAFLGLLTLVSVVMVHVNLPRAELVAVLLFAAAAAPTAAIILVQGNPFQSPTTVTAMPLAALIEIVSPSAAESRSN